MRALPDRLPAPQLKRFKPVEPLLSTCAFTDERVEIVLRQQSIWQTLLNATAPAKAGILLTAAASGDLETLYAFQEAPKLFNLVTEEQMPVRLTSTQRSRKQWPIASLRNRRFQRSTTTNYRQLRCSGRTRTVDCPELRESETQLGE
jgi:hypothetical protein